MMCADRADNIVVWNCNTKEKVFNANYTMMFADGIKHTVKRKSNIGDPRNSITNVNIHFQKKNPSSSSLILIVAVVCLVKHLNPFNI